MKAQATEKSQSRSGLNSLVCLVAAVPYPDARNKTALRAGMVIGVGVPPPSGGGNIWG